MAETKEKKSEVKVGAVIGKVVECGSLRWHLLKKKNKQKKSVSGFFHPESPLEGSRFINHTGFKGFFDCLKLRSTGLK